MGSGMAGWTLACSAGAVWGVAFFSWGLPLPIPGRVAATVLLLLAMSVASRAGRLGAGAFALGMGITSAFSVIGTGELLEWWSLIPVLALAASVALHAAMLRGSRDDGTADSDEDSGGSAGT